MKLHAKALSLSLLALTIVGCSKHSSNSSGTTTSTIPVFFEAEPNDDSFNANDMGFLYPGDLFLIEGSISDTGFDPFDGFWFTSGEAVHVDFRLFIDNQLADFDVCLYDPLLDQTNPLSDGILACYETNNNPELGGVDVLTSNVDFHLVVNSFIGSGTYALEIDVQPLFLRQGEATSGNSIIPRFDDAALQLQAEEGARTSQGVDAFGDYGLGTRIEQGTKTQKLEIDGETGTTTSIEQFPSDG